MSEILNAVTWPIVALFLGLIALLLFRLPIKELIGRTTSIDKSGLRAGSTPEAQREDRKTEAVQELLAAIGESPSLLDVEQRIRKDLEARGLETNGDTVRVLIRHLAASQLLVQFEQIHNFIFGSQIFLLKRLNEVVGQGRHEKDIRVHFEHVQKQFHEELSSWTFDQYMRFLFDRTLIVKHGDIFHITNMGVEYLTWMARNGRSENAPL